MTEEKHSYKRLSIGIDSGSKVSNVMQSASTLSEALTQELDYFQRSRRIPAEIIITKEDD